MNTKLRVILGAATACVVLLLVTATPASAQPVQPKSGEGLIAMTARICGTSASWKTQAAHNGLTGNYWLYMGKVYDIQCTGTTTSAPAAKPAAPVVLASNGWVHPLPGHCSKASSFGAPRPVGATGSNIRYRHQGIDLGASTGTPIHAATAGDIFFAGNIGNGGNQIKIRSAGGVVTKYNHLSRYRLTSGHVSAGSIIGYVGATGDATAPHLHLEVWVNGALQNPGTWFRNRGIDVIC